MRKRNTRLYNTYLFIFLMKKLSLFTGLVAMGTSLTFAENGEAMMRSMSPEAIMAAGVGGLAIVLGILLSYVRFSAVTIKEVRAALETPKSSATVG